MKKRLFSLTMIIFICCIYVIYFQKSEQKKYKEDITANDQLVNSIISQNITNDMSEYEKVKAIHNYIVATTEYDHENLENNTIPDIDYTSKGVLENHVGVCRGYAEAFKLLMDNLNIDCEILTGTSGNISHAWNIVKIDNEWYQIDCTYDDPVYEDRTNNGNTVRYDYFLITDEQMYLDHSVESSTDKKCISDKYMYLEKESGVPYCVLASVSLLSNAVFRSYTSGSRKVTYYFPENATENIANYMSDVSEKLASTGAKQFSYTPVAKCGKYYYTTITVSQ